MGIDAIRNPLRRRIKAKGIFCLEGDWWGSMFKESSVRPALELLKQCDPYFVPFVHVTWARVRSSIITLAGGDKLRLLSFQFFIWLSTRFTSETCAGRKTPSVWMISNHRSPTNAVVASFILAVAAQLIFTGAGSTGFYVEPVPLQSAGFAEMSIGLRALHWSF